MFQYHPHTRIDLKNQGASRKYVSNFQLESEYIDTFHMDLGSCPVDGVKIDIGLEGWLRRPDALKIYELAYFSSGNALEFGTNRGLSAYITACALRNSRKGSAVFTIELSDKLSRIATKNLGDRGVAEFVKFYVGDAAVVCDDLVSDGHKFGFCFVDHSHAYEHVAAACQRLDPLLESGAFVIFHDYNDRRNTDSTGVGEDNHEYGVFSAVEKELSEKLFDFVGVYGCCGVFVKK